MRYTITHGRNPGQSLLETSIELVYISEYVFCLAYTSWLCTCPGGLTTSGNTPSPQLQLHSITELQLLLSISRLLFISLIGCCSTALVTTSSPYICHELDRGSSTAALEQQHQRACQSPETKIRKVQAE